MRSSLLILICVCVVCLLLIFVFQRRLLFPTHYTPEVPSTPTLAADISRIWIESDTARTEAWFIPGRGVTDHQPGPVVVFTHGNAEVIDYISPMLRPYQAAGVSVALLEYRGYGRSTGGPSEDGIIADGLTLIERLRARPEVDPERIILHGRSLGGGVACGLAESFEPRAIILESTFTSVSSLAWEMWMPGVLVRDTFHNERRLRQIHRPVLFMHGDQDQVVPVQHARHLDSATPNSELHIWSAGHNDLAGVTHYWPTILAFVAKHTQ